ncbi:hypothetical protein [Endozoicomonas numazuensis]|uniref:Imelysin-like domain-containing protein n=1 Tax=Endozoicomonas numazuensis TaxID=1137799 RepID=A0A081NGT7_9GAMM|nr:hypothetical protein [Endozoicomonas numazuensis]KEQ17660.1 hypothetical protein GZ78_08140 [Endozoicomonas numazuensis]
MFARLCCIVVSLFYLSQSSAITLKEQFNLERQAYRVASSFYYISFDEGSSDAYQELEKELLNMDSELNAIKTPNVEQLKGIKATWEVMKDFSQKNEMKDDGYTSHYATVDLNSSRDDLIKVISSESYAEPLPSDIKALKLAADMQRLAMLYAEGSVSLIGFPYDELDVDAKKFGDQLRALQKTLADKNPEARKKAKEAVRAWAYIENALIQYYEINVPELVKRMNDVIVGRLLDVSELTAT